jgi:hypothetical protein
MTENQWKVEERARSMQMRFISPPDQQKLQSRFESELQGDVRLRLFVQPPSGLYIPGREEPLTGRQAQQLMQELAQLSDKLHLEVHNPRIEPEIAERYGIQHTPALVIEPAEDAVPDANADANADAGAEPEDSSRPAGLRQGLVRFLGLPSGYEFTTVIEDIVDVSRRRTRLSDGTREALSTLTTPIHLQVFVTPT